MSLTLKQLESFVWVADLGSFRAAAERLHTTQPNISARIAGIEATLGVTLMERDAGSVRLTPRGAQLLEHARRVLRETENLIQAAGGEALFDGVLRLGVTEMIVHSWLRDMLRAFRTRFAKVSVELTVDMSEALERALLDRRIDLALQNGPFVRNASGDEALGRYGLIWVAAPDLGLHGRALSRDALTAHPILTHARGTRQHDQVAAHFRSGARLVPSSNLAAGLQMAVQGMGVAAMPWAMVTRELDSGELTRLDYGWTPEPLEFHARFDARTSPAYVGRAARIARDTARAFDAHWIKFHDPLEKIK